MKGELLQGGPLEWRRCTHIPVGDVDGTITEVGTTGLQEVCDEGVVKGKCQPYEGPRDDQRLRGWRRQLSGAEQRADVVSLQEFQILPITAANVLSMASPLGGPASASVPAITPLLKLTCRKFPTQIPK